MLKRISNSFNKDGTAQNDLGLLIPPTPPFHQPGASPRSSPRGQHTPTQLSSFPFPAVPPSPLPRTLGPYPAGVPTSTTPSAAPSSRALDRPVLHKTLSSLSALLVALDELRDTSQAQSKARKRVAKATRDLAGGFSEKLAGPGGKGDEVAAALVSCAEMMEALQEVEEKHAKALKKEYEALNESIARYFRRTAVSLRHRRRSASMRLIPLHFDANRRRRRLMRTSWRISTAAWPRRPHRITPPPGRPRPRRRSGTCTSPSTR